MYVLELIEDCGFDGIEVTSFLVSDSKEKLIVMENLIKKDLKYLRERREAINNYLDEKYKSLRLLCKRTNEEIKELNLLIEDLKNKCLYINKHNIFDKLYYQEHGFIKFEIKEINYI